ncbi:Concanavalin A-like lectin protein kinase family protein [Rhynchospora pubera]|uniref:Concanavalin A-like lectin protein kinase family protein n=1 Tax=Rhynchospora pubera TaxID=906938 RepID=A0AAV8DEL3_9POAL|nr:Concanavalin A-like lectin protein kinase family protein [Rhynchospora pubera]
MDNSLFPLLLYLFFSLLSTPSFSLSISAPTNTTNGYFSLSFPSFDASFAYTNLTVFKPASIASNGALQITPDTQNDAISLTQKAGRIFLSQPFPLWENTSSGVRLATFSTAFDINIYRTNGSIPGEGFAFLIASSLEPPPPGSENGYLGLTNISRDGNPANKFVAIELDTFKQNYDPDDNHVGLDINGVSSTVAHSLTPFNITISPGIGTNYTVWIDYNGSSGHIWVYMAIQGNPKPAKDVLNAPLNLSEVIKPISYIGFSASTGKTYELNCVLAWELMVEKLNKDKTGLSKTTIAIIVGLSCSISAILALVLLVFYIKRKQVGDDPAMLKGTLRSLPGTPREFDFKELKKGTKNFDETMKLGQGGFGVVYKGVLVGDNGEDMAVAVKQFSRANTKGQEDFLQELTIINRLRHKHLVRIQGWCHKNGVLLLVYDFMPNGSLDQHLFGGPEKPILGWDRRYTIVIGVASALHYLHNEYDQMVVHRDLKASNIMLDSQFNARLGDFGLARALETDKTSYAELEGVPGTMGYIAPECFHTGKATRESDVYGFGATILETVCGRRPRCDIAGFHFLVDWVWKLYREGHILEAVDQRLNGNFDEDDADRLLRLGLMCSHPTPGERPKTQAIVQILSRSVPPPEVPPFKPAFIMPAAEPDNESDSSRLRSSSYTVSTSDGWTYSSNYASKEHLTNDGSIV